MTIDTDTIDVVRNWLHAEDHPSADRVVTTVLEQLDRQPQVRPLVRARPTLRGRPVQTRDLLASAAVLVVAVVGVASLTLRPGGGPAASASASPDSSPSGSSEPSPASPTPDPGGDVPVGGGPYTISTPRYTVRLSMPADWKAPPSSTTYVFKPPRSAVRSEIGLEVIPYQIAHVVHDVCAPDGNVTLDATGDTAEDLTTALTKQLGVNRAGPDFVSVGRYPARRFELRLRPECGTEGHGLVTDASRTYGFAINPGDTGLIYVVNDEGRPLVITAALGPAASIADRAELETLITTARIEPVPNAPPLPAIGPGGWMPGGAHSLTVDGVPLTFTVPKLVADHGWTRYGTLNITFDAVGSQGAEASIYWTAFPDGADTDPCPSISLPRDGSIEDLANAVASIKGAMVEDRPRDASVGGYAARYVSFRVTDDRGCDPIFLFTSDPPGGGPGWWNTEFGDTIRVWIVDVNGRRMFIVGELKPAAPLWLRRDVETIVGSISFE